MEKQYGNYLLDYLWVENYRSINNKGFHLNSKFYYSYDQKNNILKRTEKKQFVDNFYGNNINISAIVGKNGAGKTTILSAVMNFFQDSFDKRMILAFSNGEVWIKSKEKISYPNKTYYQNKIYSFSFDDGKKQDTLILNKKEAKESCLLFEKNFPISCIYYSQALDSHQFGNNNTSIINLSSANLMNCGINPDCHNSTYSVYNYFVSEYFKQIRFIEDMQDENEESIGFKLPKYVTVSPKYIDHNITAEHLARYIFRIEDEQKQEELKKFLSLKQFSQNKGITYANIYVKLFTERDFGVAKDYFDYIINEFVNSYPEDTAPFIYKLKCYLAANFFSTLCDRFGGRYASGISYFYIIKSIHLTMKDRRFKEVDKWGRMNILFSIVDDQIDEISDNENVEIKKEIRELKKLYDYLENELFLKYNSLYKDNRDSVSFTISIKNIEVTDRDLFNITLKEFWEKYKNVAKFCDFFEFSWNLSSGEMARLALYSRLYDVVISDRWQKGEYNILYRAENSILLLIDEADMLLHPEWQRTFVDDIVTVLPKIFPGQYISVIIATHSPIMLSDIPKQNVLFLENGYDGIKDVDGCNTFAANIFQLFDEAFFINAGIGAYSEKKLKDIVKCIHVDNYGKDGTIEINKLISVVGDTFLRNKLNEEYLLYHSKITSIEEKQAEKIAALETTNSSLLEDKRKIRNKSIEILTEVKSTLKNKEHIQDTSTEGEREEENRMQNLIDRVEAVLSELQNGSGEKR